MEECFPVFANSFYILMRKYTAFIETIITVRAKANILPEIFYVEERITNHIFRMKNISIYSYHYLSIYSYSLIV